MAEQQRDLYEVLGVDRNADEAAIKKAYRKLAKNIIRMPIQEIKRQSRSSKRPQMRMRS